jgi:predicted nucleic-acid-binding protein
VIGLDTNILVRLITDDDAARAAAAQRFIETECGPERPGFLNMVVLCELAWTLDRRYSFGRNAIADTIEALIGAPWLRVQRDDLIWKASKIYRDARCDFADVVISLLNEESGCAVTATFDRKAAGLDTFRLI